MPTIPNNIKYNKFEDAERNRIERLVQQVSALSDLTHSCLVASAEPGFEALWPSAVVRSLKVLTDTPLTEIGTALDAWAGAKLMISKARSAQYRSTADEEGLKALAQHKKETQVCSMFPAFEDSVFFLKRDGPNILLEMKQILPKLSLAAFEEIVPDLKIILDNLIDQAMNFEKCLWQRFCEDLVVLARAIKTASEGDSDVVETSQPLEQSAIHIGRLAKNLGQLLPSWQESRDALMSHTLKFYEEVLKPLAKTLYQDFKGGHDKILQERPNISESSQLRSTIRAGIESISCVLTSDSRKKPFAELLQRAGRNQTGENCFLDELLTLGKARQMCVAALESGRWNCHETVMELLSFVAVSPVANSICKRHIYGNISTIISQCESSFESAVLGNKELIHYQALCQDGSSNVEGFLNADLSKLKELSDQLRAV
jgi:hypothetical protein